MRTRRTILFLLTVILVVAVSREVAAQGAVCGVYISPRTIGFA